MSFYSKITKAINTKLNAQGQAPLAEDLYIPQYQLIAKARDADNDENLAMRTADPLWMLGRQWQFGEFIGEDNGSPISVKGNYSTRKATYYSANKTLNTKSNLNEEPLEVKVEAMTFFPEDLRSKVKIGQQFERIIYRRFSTSVADQFIIDLRAQYPLDVVGTTDEDSVRFLALMRGKVINGAKLLEDITKNNLAKLGFAGIEDAGIELKAWFNATYAQPGKNSQGKSLETAWESKKLLHQFNLETEKDNITLNAPDYQSGHLDWYSFDSSSIHKMDTSPKNSLGQKLIGEGKMGKNHLPVNLSYAAMPDKRLFSFEDNRVDLGSMDIQDDDLIRIMLVDFALVSGSDWYTIPFEMELGELCWMNAIEVSDVFGIKTIIENKQNVGPSLSLDVNQDNELSGLDVWDVFKIRDENVTEFQSAEHFLFLAPTLSERQESEPIEELLFLRDEYANMVWAIEKRVKNELGKTVDGFDQHLIINGPFISVADEDKQDGLKYPRYRLASNVPANWIPYLPRKVAGSRTEIALHQALMVTNEPNKPPRDILPLTYLAKEELLEIREEAIPKAGVRVQLTKQRVRWTDGKTYIWKGRKVMAGRGEGDSGLGFDYLAE